MAGRQYRSWQYLQAPFAKKAPCMWNMHKRSPERSRQASVGDLALQKSRATWPRRGPDFDTSAVFRD
jgi:hypothetical protein